MAMKLCCRALVLGMGYEEDTVAFWIVSTVVHLYWWVAAPFCAVHRRTSPPGVSELKVRASPANTSAAFMASYSVGYIPREMTSLMVAPLFRKSVRATRLGIV